MHFESKGDLLEGAIDAAETAIHHDFVAAIDFFEE